MSERRPGHYSLSFCIRLYVLFGLLYGGSVCVFIVQMHRFTLDSSFFSEALALYALIGVASAIGAVRHRGEARLGLLGIQIVCSFLIGYPLGGDVTSRILLSSGILVFCATIRSLSAAVAVSAAYIALTILSLRTMVAWGAVVSGPGLGQRVLAGVVETTFAVVGFSLRAYHRMLIQMRIESERAFLAVSQLTKANVGFQQYANTAVHRSLTAERLRISRDLHDSLGYALTNIRMLMEEAVRLYKGHNDDLSRLLFDARDHALLTLEETRTTLKELRKSETGQARIGLPAILHLVRTFRDATHLSVDLHTANSKVTYGEEVDACVYRLVQESMTNSLRHGKATEIRIHLFQDETRLLLSVSDNGRASAGVAEGIGLSGMKERVDQLGGSLRYCSTPSGFRVDAVIPVERMRDPVGCRG